MGDICTSGEEISSQFMGDLLYYHDSNLFPFANFHADPSHITIHPYNKIQVYSF